MQSEFFNSSNLKSNRSSDWDSSRINNFYSIGFSNRNSYQIVHFENIFYVLTCCCTQQWRCFQHLKKVGFEQRFLTWLLLICQMFLFRHQNMSDYVVLKNKNRKKIIHKWFVTIMVIWVVDFPREGYKIRLIFWLKINITKGKYCILWTDVVASCQKLGIILENKGC